jgi:putative addiction module component (TIGR02574 family)
MLGAREIVKEAESLPVEERAMVIDFLLRTLNPPSPEIDRQWIDTAKRRLAELRSGKVKSVPGEDVFSRVKARFAT